MSFEAIQYAYLESKVNGVARCVLAALGLYAGMDNRCFGSAARLARMTGFSRSTVIRALKELQDAGELVLEGQGGILADGSFEANRWYFPHVVIKDRLDGNLPSVSVTPALCQRDTSLVSERDTIEKGIRKKEKEQSPQAAPVAAAAQPPQDKLNPSLPSGKERDKGSAKSTKFDPLSVPLPHGDRFRHAWSEWAQHRREKRQPLTPLAAAKQLKQLAALREADAVDCIARSVTSGWSGLFTDRYTQDGQQQAAKPKNVIKAFVADPFAEELAELRALRA
jgi:hypothetical protein